MPELYTNVRNMMDRLPIAMSMRKQSVVITAEAIPSGQRAYQFKMGTRDLTNQMLAYEIADYTTTDNPTHQHAHKLADWLSGVFTVIKTTPPSTPER